MIDMYDYFENQKGNNEPPFEGNIYLLVDNITSCELYLAATGLVENNKVIFINDNYLCDEKKLFQHIDLLINKKEPYLDNMVDEYTEKVGLLGYGVNHTKYKPALPFLPFNKLKECLNLSVAAKYHFKQKKFIVLKKDPTVEVLLKKYYGSNDKELNQMFIEDGLRLIEDEINFEQVSYKG